MFDIPKRESPLRPVHTPRSNCKCFSQASHTAGHQYCSAGRISTALHTRGHIALELIDGQRLKAAALAVRLRNSAHTKETGNMCNIATPRRIPSNSGLLACTLFLVIVAATPRAALAEAASTDASE